MRKLIWSFVVSVFALLSFTSAVADEYSDTIKVFQKAGESGRYFKEAYGYAVFPNIGKGGAGIGGSRGKGRVYEKGAYVGDTTMTQLTVGLQLGGQFYQQVIFFQDKATLDKFTSGNFEFGAQATAVAITAGASAQTGTTGSSAGAGASKEKASTGMASYTNGMAVFTVAKGGLMYEASLGGQKFSYEKKK